MTAVSKPATVHDVAALAGVSAQTVSRHLSGYEGIRPKTRAKVEAALEKLDYRPNRAAQVLRTRRSRRIGVVIHEMFAFGPAGLLRGATRRAREDGYTLTIVGVDGEDDAAVTAAFDAFEEEQAAGVMAVTLTDSVRVTVEKRMPSVPILVDPAEAGGEGSSFNATGAALAAHHLAELGHRRVAMLGGPDHWLPARQRRQGFLAAVEGGAAECVRVWEGDWSAEIGDRVARELDPADGITAIFCANDAGAIGLMHGLQARGVRVPEDISVVGFDCAPEAAFASPPLTTVDAHYEEQGRAAIQSLLDRIENRVATPAPATAPALIVRGSTAPPPGRSSAPSVGTTSKENS
ncbi:LacI family DNA-binding transcriptional regulator [Demequina salsinemoris]|uniref:LacI family DNA-binding transcriptional regulator n=1 Tax=Demequina salsinemoris TaxID=577470 RepID=UPI000783D8A5|nr:LacI family DNA-binding transcriptional regulator [Demequina salsinemoris]